MNPTHADVFSFDWSYPIAFLFGIMVVASLAGWGQVVGRWLVPDGERRDVGWGLVAAWGLSAFLVLSGPLLLLSVFCATFVRLFLLVGCVLLVWPIRSMRGKKEAWNGPPTLGLKVFFIVLGLLVILTYTGAVAAHDYEPNDDFAAYFAHTKMLLDTGTVYDPFSMRLMGSLEGQQTLSTLIVAFLPWKYVHLLDCGIAFLIMLGLTQEMVSGGDRKAWTARLILIALALTFEMPRTNSASEFTGTVLFLALFRSFDLVTSRRCVGWRSALLLGGIVAAAATLRCHNIFVLGALGLAFFSWRWWEGEPSRPDNLREALATVGATLVLLAPWWVVSYRSSGVFLFPLFKGTQRPEFDTFNLHLPFLDTLQFTGGYFIANPYLLLFCPVCFLEAGRQRRALLFLGAAILLVSAAFVSQYTFGAYVDIYRYLVPIGLAYGLYSAGVAARQLVAAPRFVGAFAMPSPATLAVILASLVFLHQICTTRHLWRLTASRIYNAIDAPRELTAYGKAVYLNEARRDYAAAFAKIPLGSKTLIALDYTFLVDYKAHSIFALDVAGAASPEPGLPYFQGPAPVKKYLLAQGICYIAHVPFDQANYLYSRQAANFSLTRPVRMWRFYATYSLDFYSNVDQLAKSNRVLYDSPAIRVIALND